MRIHVLTRERQSSSFPLSDIKRAKHDVAALVDLCRPNREFAREKAKVVNI